MKRILLLILSSSLLNACSSESDVQKVTGTIPVQVAHYNAQSGYTTQVVDLQGITDLTSVSGQYAYFFYSPGSKDSGLTGSSPKAQFIKSKSFFVPSDIITLQMVTIYHHMQQLAGLDRVVGVENLNQWPRAIGLETIVLDSDPQTRRNNAFYNGPTDSMMFVPFDRQDLPLSLNAGIIAHEHFHSLFYKLVLVPALKAGKISSSRLDLHLTEEDLILASADSTRPEPVPFPTISSQDTTTMTSADSSIVESSDNTDAVQILEARAFNETLLRGLNEGLADFWGWIYTQDTQFMKYSLPGFQSERTLDIEQNQEGRFETQKVIMRRIQNWASRSDKPEDYRQIRPLLVNYAYRIGTSYARFLKKWVDLEVQSSLAKKSMSKDHPEFALLKSKLSQEVKETAARKVIEFLRLTEAEIKNLKTTETISASQMFFFFKTQSTSNEACRWALRYIEFSGDLKDEKCL